MIRMPGRSWSGPLPPMADSERDLSAQLRSDVEELAVRIGSRSVYSPSKLAQAADYIERRFQGYGYAVQRQTFATDGVACHNLEVELRGTRAPESIVIVGAHYDSAHGCPGANDNASGTAALLALAGALAKTSPEKTLRFVAFTNEEPPWFTTSLMGSRQYARRCRERGEKVESMISLETIGCFRDEAGSQQYPFPANFFYPSTGNFITFVGNVGSRALVRRAIGSFRASAKFPSEGGALPSWISGVGWSDHSSFWREGYDAIMVTDTAPFRYPHYHRKTDTPDKIDFDRCARVVEGMKAVIADLAGIDVH
jgi:Zn-dependent M28 family amino/carboxypeptidase